MLGYTLFQFELVIAEQRDKSCIKHQKIRVFKLKMLKLKKNQLIYSIFSHDQQATTILVLT